MSHADIEWQYPAPFCERWVIEPSHIDHYHHVNNVAYLSKVESLAWAHSRYLGLSFEDYQFEGKGMVIRKHELNYLLPSHLNDELACATWITSCDRRLTLTRAFQFVCLTRKKTVFSALTQFVCVNLDSGTPSRMPAKFKRVYGNAAATS